MANPKLVAAAVAALLLAAASLGAVLLSSSHGEGGARSHNVLTTLPFSPVDVLPLLPRRVAMSALRSLRGASDIFPVFVGAAVEAAETSSGGWKGACFYENEAWLEFNNGSGTAYGGGTVHIKVRLRYSQ